MNKHEEYAIVIRGEINYHKQKECAYFTPSCGADLKRCAGKGKCPKATFENDVYLEALEMSLQLLEEKIDRV